MNTLAIYAKKIYPKLNGNKISHYRHYRLLEFHPSKILSRNNQFSSEVRAPSTITKNLLETRRDLQKYYKGYSNLIS